AGSSDEELKLWWAEASEFRRDNSYIVALADPAAFDIDLDVAFTEAAAIV
ncbi:MAG: hypothetical protein JNN22_03600, partial [Rhodospirillales bacterium]|nr:hypothetical protein [Rhodospirillales bacterium]